MHISRPWQKHVQSFKKIGIKLYEELRSHGTYMYSLYTFVESEVRKWKSSQSRKSDKKLTQGLYPNHMHIFKPWRKFLQRFKKIGIKLYEELRSQGTYSLYTFVESEVKKWQSSQSRKSDKKLMQGLYLNHSHIFKPWRKLLQRFKKIGIKLYEELRSQGTHCLFIEVKKVHKVEKVISQLYPNHMHILIPWLKHLQSFKKINTKL